MQVGGKLEGEEQLRANLSQLKTAVQKRVLRKAVRAGTLPLRKAFREAVRTYPFSDEALEKE